jgi:hypothetical protein
MAVRREDVPELVPQPRPPAPAVIVVVAVIVVMTMVVAVIVVVALLGVNMTRARVLRGLVTVIAVTVLECGLRGMRVGHDGSLLLNGEAPGSTVRRPTHYVHISACMKVPGANPLHVPDLRKRMTVAVRRLTCPRTPAAPACATVRREHRSRCDQPHMLGCASDRERLPDAAPRFDEPGPVAQAWADPRGRGISMS